MDLYSSPLRITWDPDSNPVVIVDFNDDLESMIELSGQKSVQQAHLIRAAGVKSYDRSNRSTTLRLAKRVELPTLHAALALSLHEITHIPEGAADVLIQVQGLSQAYRLKNAVIGAWDGGIQAQAEVIAIIGRTITGGELIVDTP